jgi:hypothetical protein
LIAEAMNVAPRTPSSLHEPFLFLRGPGVPPEVILDWRERLERDTPEFVRVRCPHCAWQPTAGDRWTCAKQGPPENYLGCGTIWNTFSTRGRCPGCDHQWQWTCCPKCDAWARHDEWYTTDDEDGGVED